MLKCKQLLQQEFFIPCIIGWDDKTLKNYLVCIACATAIPFFGGEHDEEYLQMNLIVSLTKALLRMKLSQYFYLFMCMYYTLPYIYAHSGMVPLIMHSAANTTINQQTQYVLSTGV